MTPLPHSHVQQAPRIQAPPIRGTQMRHKQHKQEKVRTTATQHSNNTQDRSIATILQQKKQHRHRKTIRETCMKDTKLAWFQTPESHSDSRRMVIIMVIMVIQSDYQAFVSVKFCKL